MALSEENRSTNSQLQGFIDLLADLQLLNSTKLSSEEPSSSKEEIKSQGEQAAEAEEQPRTDSFEASQQEPTVAPVVEGESATDDSIRVVENLLNLSLESHQPENPQDESKHQPTLSKAESHQPENPQDESKHQPTLSKTESHQPENPQTPPEPVFNRLIQSQWQKAKALQKEHPSHAIAGNSENNIENSLELFERWQRLMLTQEMIDSREAIAKFKKQLDGLEHQIYEPEALINLLLPLITEILSRKTAQAREDIALAIAPIVDEMIQHRTGQDKQAMSSAIAPVLSHAITRQVSHSPGELAKALGPEMGPAIKEQISLERDAMVDALYPVIGSTISKYLAEAIQAINEKVENTLSFEGISRKIRAKMQGVSEAELILKEALPFTVQATFLIHKASGLVISEVQPSDNHNQHLESEMVAGMLTAIRSFANDCMAQAGTTSEINAIDYGSSKIVLEVAGYCYLAVVIQGEPPKVFIRNIRKTLAAIVQNHGKAIELFDGDPANVPEQIHQLLDALTKLGTKPTEEQKRQPPTALLLISLAVLSTTSLLLGIYQYRSWISQRIESQTSLALASDPELAVYRLAVEAKWGTLKLSGRLPNQYLRTKAEKIAKKTQPKLKIKNAIIPVEVPPDPVLAQAEVKRVTNILNQMEGSVISADYRDGKVSVEGAVLEEADARKVTEAFEQIPGVKSVTNTVQLQPLAIASRVYFDQGSAEIRSSELTKISQIGAFLEQYPNKHLKLVGHTDPKGTETENQQLAVERATKVRNVLVAQGVDSERLHVEGTIDPPLGVNASQLPLLSRTVEFKIITP
ncbi:MAG TPA: OmpA family protein [Coleofasciculaceae cyanobacterium]